MSAKIINFPNFERAPRPRNGAREALIEHATEFPNTSLEEAKNWADCTLAELWIRGFKLVPIED